MATIAPPTFQLSNLSVQHHSNHPHKGTHHTPGKAIPNGTAPNVTPKPATGPDTTPKPAEPPQATPNVTDKPTAAPSTTPKPAEPQQPADTTGLQGYLLVRTDDDPSTGLPRRAVVYYPDMRLAGTPDAENFNWFVDQSNKGSWEGAVRSNPFPSRGNFAWTIESLPEGGLSFAEECGVAIDDNRAYLVYRADNRPAFSLNVGDEALTFRREYWVGSYPPKMYPDGPIYLLVTAATDKGETRHAVAYFADGESIAKADLPGGGIPTAFGWIQGTLPPSAPQWEGRFSKAVLDGDFSDDFECCIAADAKSSRYRTLVGTAKRRQGGLLVFKDDQGNSSDPAFTFTSEATGTVQCFMEYACWKEI